MLTGTCLCGEVGLQLRPPTLFASHCHCRTCRTAHAAAFVTWTAVPTDALEVRGEDGIRWFESSPGVLRGFCGNCGSPVLYRALATSDRVYVPVALLDALDRAVEGHVSYEEHVPWLHGVAGLPCFDGKSDGPVPWV